MVAISDQWSYELSSLSNSDDTQPLITKLDIYRIMAYIELWLKQYQGLIYIGVDEIAFGGIFASGHCGHMNINLTD